MHLLPKDHNAKPGRRRSGEGGQWIQHSLSLSHFSCRNSQDLASPKHIVEQGMAWARAQGFEGGFIEKSHPGPQLRTPWAVAHPQVCVGQGAKAAHPAAAQGQPADSIMFAS